MDNFNPARIPLEIRTKLAELELELSEGDITEKGYHKKKAKLLAPYLSQNAEHEDSPIPDTNSTDPPNNRRIPQNAVPLLGLSGNGFHNSPSHSRATSQSHPSGVPPNAQFTDGADTSSSSKGGDYHRHIHREDTRYRSDIRDEAVREALTRINRQHNEALLPNKRRDIGGSPSTNYQHEQLTDDSDTSSGSPMHHPTRAPIAKPSHDQDGTSSSANFRLDANNEQLTESSNGLHSSHQDCQQPHSNGRLPHPGGDEPISSSDSFERLAAQAAAQLNLHDGTEDTFSHIYCVNRFQSTHNYPPPQYPDQCPISHTSDTAPLYSNLTPSHPVTSTPNGLKRPGVFGGVSVLPSLAQLPQQQQQQQQEPHSPSHRPDESHVSRYLTGRVSFDSAQPEDYRSQVAAAGLMNPNRVSDKIQQLVNTLKRPKRHPLPEYFLDEEDQVLVRPVIDPSAPTPQGLPSQPIHGDELVVPSGLPRNLESALQRYAGLSCKTPVLTCAEVGGRNPQVLTYAKLLQRSMQIAYMLLNKLGHRGDQSLKPRDRVALVYANNEPISFFSAFYGCILASVVPIAIEVPSTLRDASCQSMGFLLSSQDARIVLASEQCYKALQRAPSGDIITYPGWPRVTWINTDHRGSSSKPPRDWQLPDRLPNEDSLYMEYTLSREGSIHEVIVSRRATLAHCRALTTTCNYSEEDVLVCVVDCRREIGLWHALFASIFNGMHVIFVPYSVMQVDPGSWLRLVTKYHASVAIVKSRDMHWAVLSERDHANVNLSSLRMLIVADGSNPWSLNSCDSFTQKFQNRGFRPECICPAAGSPETLTVCLRRSAIKRHSTDDTVNGHGALSAAVRGIISIQSLTFGVVRVDSEDSLTSLTLQDCGQVLPGASAVVVRLGAKPILCKTDELGEICLSADYTGSGYWGLRGQTGAYFHIEPITEDGSPINPPGAVTYTRSGLLGFAGPPSSGSLLFICGCMNGLLIVAGRRHNADDIIATVLAVEPTKIVYRGRIAVFSIDLLKDERIVIVAELRQGYSDEAAFTWMSLVLSAIESIHQASAYCLALVKQNTLPRTPFGGINQHTVKRLFTEGQLHPTAILLCPHSSIQNLPQPRQTRPVLVGPSAIMCGQVVQGVRMAEARGRLVSTNPLPSPGPPNAPDSRVQLLTEIMSWRSSHTPDDRLFTVIGPKGQEVSSLTCLQLHRRAERLACILQDKVKATIGTIVALLYPPGTEMLCAFYACLLIGAIPVPIRPPRFGQSSSASSDASSVSSMINQSSTKLNGPFGSGSTTALSNLLGGMGSQSLSGSSDSWGNVDIRPALPSFEASLELLWNIVKHSQASIMMMQQCMIKLLKSKEVTTKIPFNHWPTILDTDENYRKKITTVRPCTEQPIAYIDFAASTTGTVTGIRVTHEVVHSFCRAQKMQCELYPTREVVLSLDPYSGLSFTLWALTSIHCGHHSLLVPPNVSEVAPDLWLSICSQRKVRDAFCSHYTMELATRQMSRHISITKNRDFSLTSLRSLVVVAEERPRVHLTTTFTKLFANFGLMARAVSTSFGCRVNLAISLQGASSPESTVVYVDRIGLRNDRVKLLEKGSPHSLCLVESGKLLPGVHIAIANPDTLGQCADSQLGEIWVSAPHNSSQLLGPFDNASLDRAPGVASQPVPGVDVSDALNARLVAGDRERVFARTGFLGFVRRTELTQSDGELHDAIFVVGSLEEAIMLRGMRFHPVDIETTVMRAHKKICDCAVFTWSNLLVVVAELMGEESEAMDLVHPITAQVLTEHQLIVGVVVVTDPGTVPVNSCGEKQRILLRNSFVHDKLDPIYVSYNM